MTNFLIFPEINDENGFPPAVNKAIAESPEMDAVLDIEVEARLGSLVPALVINALAADPTVVNAASAAVDEALLGLDVAEISPIAVATLSFAVVDEDGRRTWIEADDKGRPTDYAASLIVEAAGPSLGEMTGIADMNTPVTGLSFAVVDEDGRRTDLELGEDGRFTDRALDSIAGRITGVGNIPLASGPDIICPGDSLTAGSGGGGVTFPNTLAQLSGRTVTNYGQGGDGSERIAARQGGFPTLVRPVGGVIPASGPVAVTVKSSGVWGSGGFGSASSFFGVLAGVHGILSENETTTPYTYTFTRDDLGGTAVPFTAQHEPFYTDVALESRGKIHVYWSGNNYPEAMGVDAVMADLAAMIEWQQAGDKRYLVVGLINNDGSGPTTDRYKAVMEANKRMKQAYGRRFIDIRDYLREHGLADAGITPTPADIAAYDFGTIPDSLRVDTIHLTGPGYALVGQQVYRRLKEMGWV